MKWGPRRNEFLQARVSDLKKPTVTQEYRYSDGRTVLARENHTQDGGRIMVHTDITEIKRIDRLKDEFISMVSHELRTPLTSIRGSLDLLHADVTKNRPTDTERLVDIAKRNTDRLLLIVNDILDFQKIESGTVDYRLRQVELMPLVEKSIAANQAFADTYDVTFRMAEGVEAHYVNADVQRFDQVLTNLLSNAAKFSPRGSTVEVAVGRREGYSRISVHDYGPGIPPEFRDRVFERFAQASMTNARGASGTGLGLSIAKKIVEGMGGSIGFDTDDSGGCTFYFDLPEVQEIEVGNS